MIPIRSTVRHAFAFFLLSTALCSVAEAVHTLPEGWGWHRVWPRQNLDPSEIWSTPDRLYVVREGQTWESPDGIAWNPAENGLPASATPVQPEAETVYFPLVDGDPDLNDPLDDPGELAEGEYAIIRSYDRGDHLLGFGGLLMPNLNQPLVSHDGGASWQWISLDWELEPLSLTVLEIADEIHVVGRHSINTGYSYSESYMHYRITDDLQAVFVEKNRTGHRVFAWNNVIYAVKGAICVPFGSAGTALAGFEPRKPALYADDTIVYLEGPESHAVGVLSDPLDPATLPIRRAVPSEGILLDLAVFDDVTVVVDETGEVYTSLDRGLSWQQTEDQCWGGQLTATPEGFVYTTPTSFVTSPDGYDWTWTIPTLPIAEAKLVTRAAGMLAWAPNPGESTNRVWRFERNGEWQLLSEIGIDDSRPAESGRNFRMPYRGDYLSSVDLVVVPEDAAGLVFKSFQWAWDSGISPFPPLVHGNGFFVISRDLVLDDRLAYPNSGPLKAPFHHAVFNGHRFLGQERYTLDYQFGPELEWNSLKNDLYLSDPVPEFPFSEGIVDIDSWRFSEWFKWIYMDQYPWVFNYPLGWVWVNGPNENHCWLYDFHEGWFWTNQSYFPTVYTEEKGWHVHPVYAAQAARAQ